MKKSASLIFSFLFVVLTLKAQSNYIPTESVYIDSLLVKMQSLNADNNSTLRQKETSQILQHRLEDLSAAFPQYAGVMYLYLARYESEEAERKRFMDSALALIHEQPQDLLLHFMDNFSELLFAFGDEKRMDEWDRADSILRTSLYTHSLTSFEPSILAKFARGLIEEKKYGLAREILRYEIFYTAAYHNVESIEDRLKSHYCQITYFIAELAQYLQIPYSERIEINLPVESSVNVSILYQSDIDFLAKMKGRDFNEEFLRLTDTLNNFKNDLEEQKINEYEYLRFYHGMYVDLLVNFSTYAISERYPGKAILPLKIYLTGELLPATVKFSGSENATLLPAKNYQAIFTCLANLYLNTGNYRESIKYCEKALQFFNANYSFASLEKDNAINALQIAKTKAYRYSGNTEMALQLIQDAAFIYPRPDSVNFTDHSKLLHYSRVKIEKVFTYLSMDSTRKAFSLLGDLMENFDSIKGMGEPVLTTLPIWPDLLYLTAVYQSGKGNWNNEFIDEAVIHYFDHHEAETDKMYDALLLMFKVRWQIKAPKVLENLSHFLHYTELQLKYNFIMLNPEERMQFYEHSLIKIFGLYHELLFNGSLDKLPEFKERVIAQTLFLKSAMSDGNVYPEEILEATLELDGKLISKRDVNRISNLYGTNNSLFNLQNDLETTEDKMKMLLIRSLQERAIAVETTFPDWKKVTAHLKKDEVYFEFVRYKRILNDSLHHYGVLILKNAAVIKSIYLCSEKDLLTILKDATASPQSVFLSTGVSRGNELLGKKTTLPSFKNGDRDQLGELILTKLKPYFIHLKTLYFVTDGALNRISFAALSIQNKYLANYVNLRQIMNCTSISQGEIAVPMNGNAFLAGAVNYGDVPLNGQSSESKFNNSLSWNYLPGTNDEVDVLDSIFKQHRIHTHVLKDTTFTNKSAYTIGEYNFVHLSTHGFYFNKEKALSFISDKLNKEFVSQNPLTRCGLVLSGANHPSGYLEGYLMGYELADFDLRKCFLVTLSACETGLGDIRNNMGVDGLSRALKIAGAKKLLISLWAVPDRPTVMFMEKFYENVFSGITPAAALKATQIWMMDKYPVEVWAAFTLIE